MDQALASWLLCVALVVWMDATAATQAAKADHHQRVDWMRSIRDDALLKDLVLPGTHDSCAIHANAFVKTQRLSIAQQLQQGIRYFDMRVGGCQGTKHKLCMYHADFYLGLRFDDPVHTMSKFLRHNPSEAVIMRLKHEHDAKDAQIQDFQGFVEANYLVGHPQWFLHGNVSVDQLQLKHLRGHMLIFWDDGTKTSSWGYDYNLVNTRTFWDFNSVDEMFQVFEQRAREAKTVSSWFENPTSGSVGLVPVPIDAADDMNPMVLGFLIAHPDTKGIISMDAPSDKLIKMLVELNKSFNDKGHELINADPGKKELPVFSAIMRKAR